VVGVALSMSGRVGFMFYILYGSRFGFGWYIYRELVLDIEWWVFVRCVCF